MPSHARERASDPMLVALLDGRPNHSKGNRRPKDRTKRVTLLPGFGASHVRSNGSKIRDDFAREEWVQDSLAKMGLTRVVKDNKVSYLWATGFGPKALLLTKQTRA